MNIEVRGAGFDNQGASLMLLAILERLSPAVGDGFVAVDALCGARRQRLRHGLFSLAGVNFARSQRLRDLGADLLPRALPRRARRMFRFALEPEIDAVLDASGYAYGDPWGSQAAAIAAWELQSWRARRKICILMPQTFGPFSGPNDRAAMRRIVDRADLIFVRDALSFAHLVDVAGVRDHVRTAPDFTAALMPASVPGSAPESPFATLLPSARMIDRTDAGTARWYTDALISCARHCARLGLRPVLLAHETGDLELARSIAAGSGLPADVVREPDPLRAKALVGRSAFAVGSRYHGLVNALSQGVPGLAIGWCHKYLALLDDYDCPECLVRLNAPVQDLERQIDDVVREPVRQDLVHRIGEARKRVLSSIDDMWNQIRDVLRPCEFSSSPSSSPR